ncbi:MAG TPA: hypothetical protein VFH51_00885, partial [Myxococcota bacterium]|nr:hypothetical protein [Myxococcota bacterium]
TAVAGIRGTTLWGDTALDAVCSLDGDVSVASKADAGLPAAALTAGHCAAEMGKGKLTPLQPTEAQVKGYLGEVLIP